MRFPVEFNSRALVELRAFSLVLIGLSAVILPSAFSEYLELDPHLSKLELRFEIAYDELVEPVTQLNGSYGKALDRLSTQPPVPRFT